MFKLQIVRNFKTIQVNEILILKVMGVLILDIITKLELENLFNNQNFLLAYIQGKRGGGVKRLRPSIHLLTWERESKVVRFLRFSIGLLLSPLSSTLTDLNDPVFSNNSKSGTFAAILGTAAITNSAVVVTFPSLFSDLAVS